MTQTEQAQQEQLANHFANEVIDIEPSPKWVRSMLGGETVVDTKRSVLMRERGHTPVYYFPQADVRMDLMTPTDHSSHCPRKGDASYWSLTADGRTVEKAAWAYPEPFASDPKLSDAPDLRGYAAFYWDALDAWYEEDEEVFVHARDPHKRIDVLPSSRHVQVVVGGETVADTRRPVLLFEPGLPNRYYIPKLDVRMDLLVPTEKLTRCPYKGAANYHSVAVGDNLSPDIAWHYRHPTPESRQGRGPHLLLQ